MLEFFRAAFLKKPWIAGLIFITCLFLNAGVERVEITKTVPFENGAVFGFIGPYELVFGMAYFALNPKDPINQPIVDLDKAAVDEDGMVRFSSNFYVLRPKDPNKASGCLVLDIPNRGNPVGNIFNFATALFKPDEPSMAGDGFLMRHGFTLAGIGWQPDVPEGPVPGFTFRLNAPTTGPEVKGLVRSDMVFSVEARNLPLSHWRHDPYPVADKQDPRNVLTVRDDGLAERKVISRDQCQFGRWEDGKLVDDDGWVCLKKGSFEKGKIYEMVYAAENSRIVGCGLAAIRDFSSYLKHGKDSPATVNRSIAFGISQTGRILRHLLYQDMNRDEQGRKALDGVFATVAGAGRGSFNHRFAQPSRASIPFEMFFQPTDMFPFSGVTQKDPISGREDGLLKRVRASNTMPKLFLMNTGYEYWGRSNSLLHTTPDGKRDVEIDPDTRIYSLVSVQHGPANLPPSKLYLDEPNQKIAGKHLLNPANYIWVERALLMAMDNWIMKDEAPPPSAYPTIASKTLIPVSASKFPAIPGLKIADNPKQAYDIDYGPRFLSEGIVDFQPPKIGKAYGVLVPAVDEDGNELGGLRLPEIAVPIATFTSWNWRDPDTGAGDQLMALAGAFLPFPATAAEAKESGDPRRSIEERYVNENDFVGKFTLAAADLVDKGYILPEDLASMVEYGVALWAAVHEKPKENPKEKP